MESLHYDKEYFRIGEVSALCNIPVKTLRYYDEIGLIKPEKVDSSNNYRFYSRQQLLLITIIKDLKLTGFSLKEISSLINRDDLQSTRKQLIAKHDQIKKHIGELELLLSKIQTYINGLECGKKIEECVPKNNTTSTDLIEIKRIPLTPVAYTRYRCPCHPSAFIERYSQLQSLMETHNLHRAGPLMAIFHDHYTQFDYQDADIEVCVPIAETAGIDCATRNFGGFVAAVSLHKGSYNNLVNTYQSILNWLDGSGYIYAGPTAEKYIIDAGSTIYEENYVTEVILPITEK